MRTKEESIKRATDIFTKVVGENWYLAWSQKIKATRYELLGYFVDGQIVVLQVFDDGSIYHFLQINSIRWDLTEDAVRNHFADRKQHSESIEQGDPNDTEFYQGKPDRTDDDL